MADKYVKISDVMKKLNYIFRTYGVAPQMKEVYKKAISSLPYSVKGELETTLESKCYKWIAIEDDDDCLYKCSFCGTEWSLYDGTPFDNGMKYCPNCGAKMDGGADNG